MSADPRSTGGGLPRARLAWLGELLLVLVLAALFVHLGLRRRSEESGVVRVEDDEVAVVTDLWSGEQRAVLTPGFELVVPRLESVHKLDKSPVQHVMRGSERAGPHEVPKLVARARDGSLFWFERVVLQYGLDLRRLTDALQDSGTAPERRAMLIDAYAPAILAEELGRFTTAELASPESLQTATARAQERLNARLAPHGVEVYEIALSKPSFDKRYEDTLERREVAEQEIQSLRQHAALLIEAQPSTLVELEAKQELELQKLTAKGELQLAALLREAEALREERPEELEQLERDQQLTLEKARVVWRSELASLERATRELEAAAAERLAEARRAQALELEAQTARRASEEAELARAAERAAAAHAARLDALRRDAALALQAQRAERARQLEEARRTTREETFEAASYRAARLVAGEAEKAERLQQAAALEVRHRREHEGFLARAEAFQQNGAASVRAALVARLRSILFEIAPHSPAPLEDANARKAAARVAAEGAR